MVKKKENPKKIEKPKKKIKNRKEKNRKNGKRKWSLFSVVLDKICVFCLYPILDSQQYVKRGSCRRPILSGLLCLFSFLGLRPICGEFRISASNLILFFLLIYLSYRVFESFYFSYLFCIYSSYLFAICHFMSCRI